MSSTGLRYLIFHISDGLYAFDLANVAEITELPATWPIPAAPACYTGAMNFHGTIVAVMDLPAFMGIPTAIAPERLIVLDTSSASLALLVERIVRIAGHDETSSLILQDDGVFCGTFLLPEGKVTMIDTDRVVARAAEGINSNR